jgi:hypothetical protein
VSDMNEVITEVIGETDSNVVVFEATGQWKCVVLYTYNGATTFEKAEVESLVKRLTAALEKM